MILKSLWYFILKSSRYYLQNIQEKSDGFIVNSDGFNLKQVAGRID